MKLKKLTKSVKCELEFVPPFNFEGTFNKPSHFPEPDKIYEKKTYFQSMRFLNLVLGLKIKEILISGNQIIETTIYSEEILENKVLNQIISELQYRFDLLSNLKEFYDEYQDDDVLEQVLDRWKGMRISTHVSLYEFLIITTVLQNATVRRSVQMMDNLFNRFGIVISFNKKRLSSFWSPHSIIDSSEDDLREIKLGYRAKTLKRQAKSFVDGEFHEFELRKLHTNDLKEILISIYGVGPATAQYLLFEVFKRYDVLDYIPPWEQRIYSKLLFNKKEVKKEIILNEINQRWDKWKMLAVHYLFEDLFWQRQNKKIPWLEELIKL